MRFFIFLCLMAEIGYLIGTGQWSIIGLAAGLLGFVSGAILFAPISVPFAELARKWLKEPS
jgi:membrane protein implicated in regulation of membrane protease activity